MQPEEDQATATGDLHNKFREDWFNSSRDMFADRHTHTHTHTDCNTPLPYQGRVKIVGM